MKNWSHTLKINCENISKWARGDSNPGPHGYQPCALPPEPRAPSYKKGDFVLFNKQ